MSEKIWKLIKQEFGKVIADKDMQPETIYYCERKTKRADGFFKFICPICKDKKHIPYLPFEYNKQKEEWWSPKNTWSFKPNEEPFRLDPSIQFNYDCKGHIWFKQGKPRIY